ncbi:MAG: hypothetical protein EXQ89_00720 [Rhodospirillaceae bacterium]|nr:hypothetical protein [Rhodospirillaceae bacterium]
MLEALDIKSILLNIERTVRQLDAPEEPTHATDTPTSQPAAQKSERDPPSNADAYSRGNRAA